jgi:hypothetical protein
MADEKVFGGGGGDQPLAPNAEFGEGLTGALAGVKGSTLTPDSGPKFGQPTSTTDTTNLQSILVKMTNTPEKLANFTAFISALDKLVG